MIKYIFALALSVCLFTVSCASSKQVKNESENKIEKSAQVKTDNGGKEKNAETPVYAESEEEYARSTVDVDVTREEFSSDKKERLRIISELSQIMEKSDYESWLNYIEPDSIKYWSNIVNLSKAARRLPVDPKKPLERPKLNNLQDYFKLVFVRSRKGRSVSEIRYISRDSVKAVQVEDDRDIVYYNFVRVNKNWMISIPKS